MRRHPRRRFPYGPAGGIFNPATLSPTGWWRGSFAASPWVGVAGGNLAEGTNPPAVGAAQGAYSPADFDGTNDRLVSVSDWSTLISAGAGTVLVLFRADTAAPAAADTYDDPGLVSDGIYGFNLGFSDGGVGIAHYDSVDYAVARVACGVGAYHLAKCRWDGVNVEIGVDGGAMTSEASGNLGFLGGTKLTVGSVAISAPAFFDGRILEVLVANTTLSDADIVNYRSYVNARYGLSV